MCASWLHPFILAAFSILVLLDIGALAVSLLPDWLSYNQVDNDVQSLVGE
jgi:hypothetical protein